MESIIGGVLIGLAVSMMLLFNGRVTGISGIMGGILNPSVLDKNWRLMFVLGLFLGGLTLKIVAPDTFTIVSNAKPLDYIAAGFLVGFGTLMGNGCTSGHAVCGISRFSVRSVMATVTFIFFGVVGVLFFKMLRGEI